MAEPSRIRQSTRRFCIWHVLLAYDPVPGLAAAAFRTFDTPSRFGRSSGVGGDRKAVARHMVALSTYLGHAHVSDTYWYLQATPKLLCDVAKAAESLHLGGEL